MIFILISLDISRDFHALRNIHKIIVIIYFEIYY